MRVLLAAGKTGGHIFPALALAREFRRREGNAEILLVVNREKVATGILEAQEFPWETIEARPLQGTGVPGKVQAVLMLLLSLRRAGEIIRRFRPQVVVGMGGYGCAALLVSALWRRIPCFLQEQNLLPGLTNRWLGRFVKKVFTSFPGSERFFPPGKTLCTGNPVRAGVGLERADYRCFGLRPGRFTILLCGGSQGAHHLNVVMMEALRDWSEDDKRSRQVIHQSGERDYQEVRAAYREQGVIAHVSPFIERMEEAYALADVVICRAGAGTVAELARAGKAAILVPYPYAADDHQTANARYLQERGAALMIPQACFDARRLCEELDSLQNDAAARRGLQEAVRRLSRPEAARDIVTYLLENYA